MPEYAYYLIAACYIVASIIGFLYSVGVAVLIGADIWDWLKGDRGPKGT